MIFSKLTPLFVAGALAASAGAAGGYPATVAAPTAMRAGPGMAAPIIAMIPANAPLNAGPCRSWRRLRCGAAVGFVPSPRVIAGIAAPAYYGAADPGPLGLLSGPADDSLFDDPFGDYDYGYGEAAPPPAPPVMAGY